MKHSLKSFLVLAALVASFGYSAPRVEAQSINTSVCLLGVPSSVVADLAEGRTTLQDLRRTYGDCLSANMGVITDGLLQYIKESKKKTSRQIKACAKSARALKSKK